MNIVYIVTYSNEREGLQEPVYAGNNGDIAMTFFNEENFWQDMAILLVYDNGVKVDEVKRYNSKFARRNA